MKFSITRALIFTAIVAAGLVAWELCPQDPSLLLIRLIPLVIGAVSGGLLVFVAWSAAGEIERKIRPKKETTAEDE